MNETLEYVKLFASFPMRLHKLMQHELILEEAQNLIHKQIEQRESSFLQFVEQAIYGYPRSPYLSLLKSAGCEMGDLRRLVESRGLENALRQLRDADVYVTFEEFKGRKPISRNGITIPVAPKDFDNPISQRDFRLTTGGSTGRANSVYQDFEHVKQIAVNEMITLSAYGALDSPTIHWTQLLPGGGIRWVLQRALHSKHIQHWYSAIGWRDSRYWLKYGVATLYMLMWMKAWGVRVKGPRIAKPHQASIIARTLRHILDTHGRVLLYASASQALRACVAAQDQGFDLAGMAVRTMAEPLTPAKAALIESAGARIIPGYGSVETGPICYGCLNRTLVDDLHLMKNRMALITHPHTLPNSELTVPAFNLTTLRRSASKVMLNYQSDDYGIVETRKCGCELEQYGCTTHLHNIRSYSKLVGEGVTLIGNEMVRILEEELPTQFGGTPLDYQMMEEEDAQGLTRLVLIISPRVHIDDEQKVIRVVLSAMQESSPMSDAARAVWQNAQTIFVRRCEPILTARGKLLPLHLERN